jgi:glutathione S-transferase
MITIYHVEARRSERIVWLMEELGLPYQLEFKLGDLLGSVQTIRELHPLGTAPTVRDGDIIMVESGAILEYISRRYGNDRLSVEPSSAEFPRYLQWLHFAEGSAAFRIIIEFVLKGIPGAMETSPIAKRMVGGTEKVLRLAEAALAERAYFGGDSFTLADIMMHFPLKIARMWGYDMKTSPRVANWVSTVEGRPAYRRAMERSMPNGIPSM